MSYKTGQVVINVTNISDDRMIVTATSMAKGESSGKLVPVL